MTLYYLGRPVQTSGDCDDGWVWGSLGGKLTWFWMSQLYAKPWGAR